MISFFLCISYIWRLHLLQLNHDLGKVFNVIVNKHLYISNMFMPFNFFSMVGRDTINKSYHLRLYIWTYFWHICWLSLHALSSVLWCPLRFPHKNYYRFFFTSSYLRYLCFIANSGVQHILCCVFVLFFFVVCTLYCQLIWIALFWFPLRYSLTFIWLESYCSEGDKFSHLLSPLRRCNTKNVKTHNRTTHTIKMMNNMDTTKTLGENSGAREG
jgi:hypothetical protein